ncbi:MAG: metalloregulator ArsR/SmtB family transcription factor [Cyclobacteriaceae bacterium]|nr:metalloregulator ArsR/SmtB family transcription factor [Cyclobacteriaceae bacterium]
MGAIKPDTYNETQETLATIARALGHPARISILQELEKQQSCQCGLLAETMGLAQSTVSQHLKELKNAGLIKGSIEESKTCYCLSSEKLNELIVFLSHLIKNEIQKRLLLNKKLQ